MNIFQIMTLVSENHPNKFEYGETVTIINSLTDIDVISYSKIGIEFIEKISKDNKLHLNNEFDKEFIKMCHNKILFVDLNISYGKTSSADWARVKVFVTILILSKNSDLFFKYLNSN